jgi:hypothetical protein
MNYSDKTGRFSYIRFITLVLLAVLISNNTFAQDIKSNTYSKKISFFDIQKYYKDLWGDDNPGKGKGWKQFKRMEYFLSQRVGSDGTLPPAAKIFSEFSNYLEKHDQNRTNANKADWKSLGPVNQPNKKSYSPSPGLGRINCIEMDPNNSSIIWAGASFGGVWKSTNGGANWVTFPFTEFMSIGITDIKISKQNSNIVYAATGDADGAGVFTQYDSYSIGMIKTTDGGATWALAGLQNTIDRNVLINSILVNPSDDKMVFAATNKGLYMTTNGGTDWTNIYNKNAVRHIVFKPDDPNTIYCALYTDFDGFPSSFIIAKYKVAENEMKFTKIMESSIARVVFATSGNNVNGVYVLASMYENNSGQGFHSIQKSTDGGENWTIVNARANGGWNYLYFMVTQNYGGGQGIYDLSLTVAPNNFNEIYIGGVNIWKSSDGGKNFSPVAEWSGYVQNVAWVHADIHELQFDQLGNIWAVTDGGVNKSTNRGINWTDLSNGLEITSFYRLSCAKTNDKIMLLGAQDNGTHRMKNGVWDNVGGGDGMANLIDYSDPNYMYSSIYNGNFDKSTDGGNTFNQMLVPSSMFGENGAWITPIEIDPINSSTIYIGLYNLIKSTNRGQSFTKVSNLTDKNTFTSLRVAPSNTNYIYGVKSTSGTGSNLIVSKDGGKNWINVYTSGNVISDIEIDPKEPNRVWITISGYNEANKVIEILGTQVKNISAGLPNVPVNTIVLQKNSPDRLYIGTDYGVFYSESPGRQWVRFNDNLPNVVVSDLVIQENIGYLRAATYGRGLWQTKIIDCNLRTPNILYNGQQPTGDINVCEGTPVILECDADYASYEWSNGESGVKNKSINITESGKYFVTVRDENGCSAASVSVTVNIEDKKVLKITANATNSICEGGSLDLVASFGFSSYKWSNGMTTKKITIKEPGTYSCVGTTAFGCLSETGSIDIKQSPIPPQPTITKELNTLVSSEAATYQWYLNTNAINGATGKTHLPLSIGDYQVETGNAEGCKNISEIYKISEVNSVNDIFSSLKYINIIPNPTNGTFVFETFALGNELLEISITDIVGRTITESKMNISGSFSKVFDLGNAKAGIYFLTLKVGGRTYQQKIVRID